MFFNRKKFLFGFVFLLVFFVFVNPTSAAQFGGGGGAVFLQNEEHNDYRSATEVPGWTLSSTVQHDGGQIGLERTDDPFTNFERKFSALSTNLTTALGVQNIVEFDVVEVGNGLFIAFVERRGDFRVLRITEWDKENNIWSAPFYERPVSSEDLRLTFVGGPDQNEKYTSLDIGPAGESLTGIKHIVGRKVVGGDDYIMPSFFFEDDMGGDIYWVQKRGGVWKTVNISKNDGPLASDFYVDPEAKKIVWLDNRTSSEFGGDIYESTYIQRLHKFDDPVLAPKAGREHLVGYMLSHPVESFPLNPNSTTFFIAETPRGESSVGWSFRAGEPHLTGWQDMGFDSLRLFTKQDLTGAVVVAKDREGVYVCRTTNHGCARVNNVTEAVVAENNFVLVYKRNGAIYIQHLNNNGSLRGGEVLVINDDPTKTHHITGTGFGLDSGDSILKEYVYIKLEEIGGRQTLLRASINIRAVDLPIETSGLEEIIKGNFSNTRFLGRHLLWLSSGHLNGLRTEDRGEEGYLYKTEGTFTSGKINTGDDPVRRVEMMNLLVAPKDTEVMYKVSNDGGAAWHTPLGCSYSDHFEEEEQLEEEGRPYSRRDICFDFPQTDDETNNDLRVKVILKTNNSFVSPSADFIFLAYYPIPENVPPEIGSLMANQSIIGNPLWVWIGYKAADANGGPGQLTAEYQSVVDWIWRPMSYISAFTNNPEAIVFDRTLEASGGYTFVWDLFRDPHTNNHEAGVPLRLKVSDGELESEYAETIVNIDTKPPRINSDSFRVDAATPFAIGLRWDPALDFNDVRYAVKYIKLPRRTINGEGMMTCDNAATPAMRDEAMAITRMGFSQDAGFIPSAALNDLFSNTCYLMALEAKDDYENAAWVGPIVARTQVPPEPQAPTVRLIGAPRQENNLLHFNYEIIDNDSRTFNVTPLAMFTDADGVERRVPMSSAGRDGDDGERVSFPDDQIGGRAQFHFVWEPASDLLLFDIIDNLSLQLRFAVSDMDGLESVPVWSRTTIDVLPPRMFNIHSRDITHERASLYWGVAEDDNFDRYELWRSTVRAVAFARQEGRGASIDIIRERETNTYNLTSLEPRTRYYVCLHGFDRSGNRRAPSCADFTTQAAPVNRPPSVENARILDTNAPFGEGRGIIYDFEAKDLDGDNVRLIDEYSEDGVNWRSASGGTGEDVFVGASPRGEYMDTSWLYTNDLAANFEGGARIRLTLVDAKGGRSGPVILGPIVIDQTGPTFPGIIRTVNIDEDSVHLFWEAASDFSEISGYTVIVKNGITDRIDFNDTIRRTNLIAANLSSGTIYDVEVRAIDNIGNSTSKTASFVTSRAGTPVLNPSVLINGGAAETNSARVNLELSAGNAEEMWVSDSASFFNSGWTAFREFITWDLSIAGATSKRTVYAKFRNSTGAVSEVVMDSINYVPEDDGADVDVGVKNSDAIDVVIQHEQNGIITTADLVRFTATKQGEGNFRSIGIYIDGHLQRTCFSSLCQASLGPFEAGPHTYWAVIMPREGPFGVRSEIGFFNVENEPASVRVVYLPTNPYAGRAVRFGLFAIGPSVTHGRAELYLDGELTSTCSGRLRSAALVPVPCLITHEAFTAGVHTYSAKLIVNGAVVDEKQGVINVRPVEMVNPPAVSLLVIPENPDRNDQIFILAVVEGDANFGRLTIAVDGVDAETCRFLGCSHTIPGGTLAVGRHTIKAYTDGEPRAEASVVINVSGEAAVESPEAPPAIQLSVLPEAPTVNDVIRASVVVSGSYDLIEIFIDGNPAPQTSCAASPCEAGVNLAEGQHVIKARATYTRGDVRSSVEESKPFAVTAEDPPQEEDDIINDQPPQSVFITRNPVGDIVVSTQHTITGQTAGPNLRIDKLELYIDDQIVRICRAATVCSYGRVENAIGQHSYFMKYFYYLGEGLIEESTNILFYRVVSQDEADQVVVDIDEFDAQNNILENNEGDAQDDKIVTNEGGVRIQANGGNLCLMRFSLDPAFSGAEWLPYESSYNFKLPPGNGMKILYIQYKTCSGKLSPVYIRKVILTDTPLENTSAYLTTFKPEGSKDSESGLPPATAPEVISTFSFLCGDTEHPRDVNLLKRLLGRIIIAVERDGEGFYLYKKGSAPDKNICAYYLGRPHHAFGVMRFLGEGMFTRDIARMFKDFSTPAPGDLKVFEVKDRKLAERFKGKIVLEVEENGEAYYIDPIQLKGYYLGRPKDAFRIMRELGLGISNVNLAKIPLYPEILKAR